jgi:hypothetical protein
MLGLTNPGATMLRATTIIMTISELGRWRRA